MAVESQGYEDVSREMVSGVLEWRQQHPHATLAELEAQVQERLAELHARFLEELALASGRGKQHPRSARAGDQEAGVLLEAVRRRSLLPDRFHPLTT